MSKTFKIVDGDISDGYHTFDELYEHRCLLFLVIARACADRFYWKPDFEGWFCLYWESPEGQISYHIPNKHLPLIQDHVERDDEHIWDKHTSKDVVARLEKIIAHSPARECEQRIRGIE